jgi:hypothetical protein
LFSSPLRRKFPLGNFLERDNLVMIIDLLRIFQLKIIYDTSERSFRICIAIFFLPAALN